MRVSAVRRALATTWSSLFESILALGLRDLGVRVVLIVSFYPISAGTQGLLITGSRRYFKDYVMFSG